MQKLKGIPQDGKLLGRVKRLTKRMTKRPTQERDARWPDPFCYLSQDRNRNGRNACGFDCTLNQSDGPIAEASSWGEKDKIRFFGSQF